MVVTAKALKEIGKISISLVVEPCLLATFVAAERRFGILIRQWSFI